MSVINRNGLKVILGKDGMSEIWRQLQKDYLSRKPYRQRWMAMFCLREMCGWTIESISFVVGQPKGHVSRCLKRIKEELVEQFEVSPTLFSHVEEEELMEEFNEGQTWTATGR